MTIDAVVVGSGPNGLAAAALLATAGRSVVVFEAAAEPGGGCRSAALTRPGFRHDVGAAVMPFGVASEAFRQLDLESHGVEWLHHDVEAAHPLDDGPAVLLHRSIDQTAAGLGSAEDAARWRRLMAPFRRHGAAVVDHALDPLSWPRHPLASARFAASAWRSVGEIAARFTGPRAAALLAGIGAHAARPLTDRLTGGVALGLGGAGHVGGWPIPRGGAGAVTAALVAIVEAHGGEIVTGHRVEALAALPPRRATLLDVGPLAVNRLAGAALAPRFRRRLDRFRYGNAVFKVDYALAGPVPWRDPEVGRAGTVHLGGTAREIARAEWTVTAGAPAARPYVLVAQPSTIDPTRAPAGHAVLWAYCHVPSRCAVDVTATIEDQIERFAPGFRDLVLDRRAIGPDELEAGNANFVGGDISGGIVDLRQMIARPLLRRSPWTLPIPDTYLCSASTLPGSGVHGMGGLHAATAALAGPLRG